MALFSMPLCCSVLGLNQHSKEGRGEGEQEKGKEREGEGGRGRRKKGGREIVKVDRACTNMVMKVEKKNVREEERGRGRESYHLLSDAADVAGGMEEWFRPLDRNKGCRAPPLAL